MSDQDLPTGGDPADDALMRELFPLDDGSGPAPAVSDGALDAMVAEALRAMPPGPSGSGGSGDASVGPARGAGGASSGTAGTVAGRWGLRIAGASALGLLALGTMSCLSGYPDQATLSPLEGEVVASDDAVGRGVAPPSPQPAPEPAPAPDSQPSEQPEPSPASAVRAARQRGRAAAPASARDLLREANALRGRGQYRRAEQTYLRVVRQHSGSSSAYVARVAAAGLRLDRLGNPRGALSLYRAALRQGGGGALGPEVRRGVALSTRRLGMRDAEARALRDFIGHHGGAPFAARARQRLLELDEPSRATPAPSSAPAQGSGGTGPSGAAASPAAN